MEECCIYLARVISARLSVSSTAIFPSSASTNSGPRTLSYRARARVVFTACEWLLTPLVRVYTAWNCIHCIQCLHALNSVYNPGTNEARHPSTATRRPTSFSAEENFLAIGMASHVVLDGGSEKVLAKRVPSCYRGARPKSSLASRNSISFLIRDGVNKEVYARLRFIKRPSCKAPTDV